MYSNKQFIIEQAKNVRTSVKYVSCWLAFVYRLCSESVPSLSTLQGVKAYIEKMGNVPSISTPKRVVMLDWVSNEDGSHILTVTVGNKVIFMTAVSNDVAQANVKAVNESKAAEIKSKATPLLRKSSSMGFQQVVDDVR